MAPGIRLFRVIQPVPEMEEASAFYATLLGDPGQRGSPGRHYLDCGGVLLACHDAAADGDGGRIRPARHPLYFAVEQIDLAWARAREAGAEPSSEVLDGAAWVRSGSVPGANGPSTPATCSGIRCASSPRRPCSSVARGASRGGRLRTAWRAPLNRWSPSPCSFSTPSYFGADNVRIESVHHGSGFVHRRPDATAGGARPVSIRRGGKIARSLGRVFLSLIAVACPEAAAPELAAQAEPTPRILEQDSTLNNLVDPPGYQAAAPGTLGSVATVGDGPGQMILVPGLGFGGDVFEPLMERLGPKYTMYAVTLAGFGGTAAPPTPPLGTSFGDQTWTDGATAAVEELMVARDLRDVVLVGHWLGGTQIALRLAHRRPDRVRAVVLLAGSARWVPAAPAPAPDVPLEQRIRSVDDSMAPNWFRTVTRETWDDNNFHPHDYSANPIVGLRLWREAARPPLHVWVRYLCEFLAQDATALLPDLTVPVLALHPGLEGLFYERDANYVEAYTRRSWGDGLDSLDNGRVAVIANARIVMWHDRPEAVGDAILAFLEHMPVQDAW